MLENSKIVEVANGMVTLQLDLNIYEVDNLIGKNLTFVDKDNKFIGEIANIKNNIANIYLLGYINNGKFIFGDLLKPSFNSKVYLTPPEELDTIYSDDVTNIKIGTSYIYPKYKIGIDVNKFFSNHFAILGNTGSGKSYAVSSLIQKIFYESMSSPFKSNFFIFDAYGEYKNCFTEINKKFNNINYRLITTDLKSNNEHLAIPFYLLGVDDLALLLDAEEPKQIQVISKALSLVSIFAQKEENVIEYKNDIIARCLLDIIYNNDNLKIRTQIVSILSKFYTKDIYLEKPLTRGGWTLSLKQCLYINENGKIQDIELVCDYLEKFVKVNLDYNSAKIMYYTVEDFYVALEFALISEGILSSDKVFDYANVLKVRLDTLIKGVNRNYFIYDELIDKNEYICRLLMSSDNRKYQIINFNINSLDDRFAKVIVKILSKWLFDFTVSLEKRAKFPIHIILEEAHRYVQNDRDAKLLGYNIFDRIAKEGRKYGIILGLISQRPGELSEVTISQISNFLIFKMFHKQDLEFVGQVLPSIANYNIDRLKMLYPGVCMATGSSFKMPTIIKMDMPNPSPLSENVDILKTWYN